MAKREYILREEALSHPFANGKYDHKYASIDFILGHESYEEWLETLHAFTEQDIKTGSEEQVMLREEIEKYTKLTGEDASHVPIIKLGAYLDGYEKGMEVLDKIRAEIEQNAYPIVHGVNNHELGMTLHGILQVIDKYKAESEVMKDGNNN